MHNVVLDEIISQAKTNKKTVHGQAEMPECDDQASKHQCCKKMKTTGSEKVYFVNETLWRDHTETLIKQGHFLCLAMLENLT